VVVGHLLVVVLGSALPARPGPSSLERFEVPVEAVALDVADGFATSTCVWWAKRCWPTFSPPQHVGTEGAPTLACAVTPERRVSCWAMVTTSLWGPQVVVTPLPLASAATDVSVSTSEVCVLGQDGALDCLYYAWDTGRRVWVFDSPWRIAGRWRAADAGAKRTCALAEDGGVYCWTSWEDCTNLDEDTRPRPVRLSCARPPPQPVRGVTGGQTMSASWLGGCVIRADGHLGCWDENVPGIDWQEYTGNPAPRPVMEVSQPGVVVATAASNSHACAVRKNGDLFCWAAARGVAAFGAGTQDIVRIATNKPVREVAVHEGLTCWIDDAGDASCREGSAPAELLVHDATLLAVGGQICARLQDSQVACWADALETAPRPDDVLLVASATAFWGGGVARLGEDAVAASDLGVRAELNTGRADHRAELSMSVGPIIELRTRDLRTRELAGGVVAHLARRNGDPGMALAVLGGYADRPRQDEAFVATLGRFGLRHEYERELHARGYAHYMMAVGFYWQTRYGLRSRHVELTMGLELDLSLPVALADELTR
jgi:hypothetical protein